MLGLRHILELTGDLQGSAAPAPPRRRFRDFLANHVIRVGDLADFIEEAWRLPAAESAAVLPELAGHLGRFLGFSPHSDGFVGGAAGCECFWVSPTGLMVVLDVRCGPSAEVRTSAIMGHMGILITQRKVHGWQQALGLFVLAGAEADPAPLVNTIVREGRGHQLRVVTLAGLLSLAEMVAEGGADHAEALALLAPGGPLLDGAVGLIARLAGQKRAAERLNQAELSPGRAGFWLTPVGGSRDAKPGDRLHKLIKKAGVFPLAPGAPGRAQINAGDWVCFYQSGKGVVGHARVAAPPAKKTHPQVPEKDKYPYLMALADQEIYPDKSVVLDSDLRGRLEAFAEKDPARAWSWFVISTSRVSEHDFRLLTGRG